MAGTPQVQQKAGSGQKGTRQPQQVTNADFRLAQWISRASDARGEQCHNRHMNPATRDPAQPPACAQKRMIGARDQATTELEERDKGKKQQKWLQPPESRIIALEQDQVIQPLQCAVEQTEGAQQPEMDKRSVRTRTLGLGQHRDAEHHESETIEEKKQIQVTHHPGGQTEHRRCMSRSCRAYRRWHAPRGKLGSQQPSPARTRRRCCLLMPTRPPRIFAPAGRDVKIGGYIPN
ncbi:MAG: hypothetical protein AB1409_12170 [Pseudomonadota bacterium]